MPRDQVFISYSHEDTKWREDLEKSLKPYLRDGSIKGWSDKQIIPGSQWFGEIQSALANSKVAVLLVTPDFLASDFIYEHELGPLLKEAEQGGVTILWVPIYPSAYKQTALEKYQAVINPNKPLASLSSKAKRDEAWVTICEEIGKAVKAGRPQPPIYVDQPPSAAQRAALEWNNHLEQESGAKTKGMPPWRLNPFPPSRLHVTGKVFKGRDIEISVLERAWATGDAGDQKRKINIVAFVGQGGEGKTHLVFNWLGRVAADGWRGAERMFDWSFLNPGANDQRAVSADPFFDAALRWLGEAQPERLTGWSKGERLAALIAERRTFFVLDGLEPLQHPPGASAGQVRDHALRALLIGLAQNNRGMCILTTREPVTDLAPGKIRPACDTTSRTSTPMPALLFFAP